MFIRQIQQMSIDFVFIHRVCINIIRLSLKHETNVLIKVTKAA